MTLIITVGCPDYILQVSDRRFTWLGTGSPPKTTDEENKELVVRAAGANFAVSFTGLGQIEGKLTGSWLMDCLNKSKAVRDGFDQCVRVVKEEADKAFDRMARASGKRAAHAFIFSGFRHEADRPMVAVVSNYRSDSFEVVPLESEFRTVNLTTARYPYHQDGCTDALEEDAKSRIRSAIRKSTYGTVGDLIVDEIRRSTSHAKLGRYVGRNCMLICVFRSGRVESLYYPEHAKPTSYGPSLITEFMSFGGVSMHGAPGPITLGPDGGLKVFDRRAVSFEKLGDAIQRGITAGQEGRHEEALTHFSRVLEVAPDNADALAHQTASFLALKAFKKALETLDLLEQVEPNTFRLHGIRGTVLLRFGRFEEALTALDQAIRLQPDSTDALVKRGVALDSLDRHNEAIEAYDAALEIQPEDHIALYNRGTSFNALGRFAEALADFNKSLELSPDRPETLTNRGVALGQLGRHEEALRDLNQVVERHPDLAPALLTRGTILRHLDRNGLALSDYDKALRLQPRNPDFLTTRGVLHGYNGHYFMAFADHNRALELEPSHVGALYNRACLYALIARPDEALADLRRALDKGPEHRKMARDDEDFDNLRNDPEFRGRFKKLVGEPEPPDKNDPTSDT